MGKSKIEGHREESPTVTFGVGTSFNGFLQFKETLRIKGKFKGTIEAAGALIVDKGAVVEADRISVTSLTVYGTVIAPVIAQDKIICCPARSSEGI